MCRFTGPLPLLAILMGLSSLAPAQIGVNIGWLPVTEAERKLAAPIVEKDAGVEAIFWRVHVLDEVQGSDLTRTLYHYVRLKIFSEKGKEKAATIDIPFDSRTSIIQISGRTIKADGSIVELKKDAIHERNLVRAGRFKRAVRSFAMPAVEPGAIVEYRWKEVRGDPNIRYTRLQLQREFPVHRVTYFVKPLSLDYSAGYTMGLWPFNCKPSPLIVERDSFQSTFIENVPGFKDEPMMPAEPNVRPWILIFYHNKSKRDPKAYWNDIGKEVYKELKQTVKLSNEVKLAATSAVADVPEQDKIAAIVRYIRKNVRGLFDDAVTDAERAKFIRNLPQERRRNSAEVLESGIGTPDEMNSLFAAMATHVGLDARPVLIADRTDVLFDPVMADRYFLRNLDIAVKQDGAWKIFDVSTRSLAPGLLSWQEAGMLALISDPKNPEFVNAPAALPEQSLSKRTARLTLSANGTLEGEMEESYTGHTAYDRRLEFAGNSPGKNEERLKDVLSRVFPRSEVSELKIENAEDPEKPLSIRFKIVIPQYAGRTGKRLFLHPAVFQRGDPPLFESASREHEIHFRYPWQESDDIRIELPEGFALDAAGSPGTLNFGTPGQYSMELLKQGESVLICRRNLVFGAKGIIGFPKDAYPNLKTVFDEIHRRDNHSISLKQGS
ncbi:MAG: DUF3857 and transglutaminase domain-containing protein [Bryobacteraceae bacterium]|nr:DUF3857 and transglutaminase domain-containing protein [Bryobacteraceae bacterium]